jgi:hypothetical protein
MHIYFPSFDWRQKKVYRNHLFDLSHDAIIQMIKKKKKNSNDQKKKKNSNDQKKKKNFK